MALLGASRVAVTPERSPPGASVAVPWAALDSGKNQLSRWARQEGKMPPKETTSQYGEQERAQAAEAGAWGATVGAGEAVRCVTRAGGRSILGGQGKEVRGQQKRLLRHSRGTQHTPGTWHRE